MKPAATIALCLGVFVIGFFAGRFSYGIGPLGPYQMTSPGGAVDEANIESQEGSMTIDISRFSEGQKQMLRTFGIEGDSITVTPSMIACAEAQIGASRVAEIKGGATPTMGEGAILLACYQSQ